MGNKAGKSASKPAPAADSTINDLRMQAVELAVKSDGNLSRSSKRIAKVLRDAETIMDFVTTGDRPEFEG